MEFRNLTADDIEVRVQSVVLNPNKTPKGVILLLYKNARVDMAVLDETIGVENWQREHYECKGNLFCRVGINVNYDTDKPEKWVWKSDCGSESNTSAEKGEASDSFKRACFNWGIGRELYTSPLIWIKSDMCTFHSDGRCKDHFSVEKIAVENKKIVGLSIINNSIKTDNIKDKRCFVWSAK